ncbi:MAG: transcriptional regulator [Methanomassiliicoccaceae archaeon]|nr:transcriptional regulator [Methanomassiliicoccaceae archaeon]
MRFPCETIVVDVLPIIRKELSIELVNEHNYTKAAVAKMFEVSGTAISQYTHGMRGNSRLLKDNERYGSFMKEIYASARLIATEKSTVTEELCRLCNYAKELIIPDYTDEDATITCGECPRKNL